MAWKIEVSAVAEKDLARIGTTPARRIVKGLRQIAALDDPGLRGKALGGNLAGYWRWRFGDYCVIARIEDHKLVILVVTIGHRCEVYD